MACGIYQHVVRSVVDGPNNTFGVESKGELACQLRVCNSACIIHNVTEAWGQGRGGKNRKTRDSRYSVAGAGVMEDGLVY